MLNFRSMIVTAAQTAGDRPVVAAPYPLNRLLCRDLADQGVISGYVEEHTPSATDPSPSIAGWWVNQPAGIWFLRYGASPTMLMLSAEPSQQLDGGLLLEARMKGIRRILYVAADGSVVTEIDVAAALLRLLRSTTVSDPVHQVGYDKVFEEIYRVAGTHLRLPPTAFVPDRVLILIGSLQAGGAQRQAAYTASGLAKRFPKQVFIGCCEAGGDHDFYKPYVHAAGVQTCLIPQSLEVGYLNELVDAYAFSARTDGLGSANLFRLILQHAALIARLRPEVVHTWMDYSNTLGGVAADLVGVPRLIMSGRSVAPDNFTIFEPYMEAGYRALLKRRDAILLNNSEAGACDYARWLGLPIDRFRVIRNGYEFPASKPSSPAAARETLGIPHNAVVVGSIFVFREEKRPLLWLEMARVLHRRHPEVRFVIYGDGPMLSHCRAFVQAEGLSAVVVMPGATSDVWTALSAIDVFVLTSRVEGLPNVMIEAQLAGVPVVCTGSGGMCETFVESETGFGVSEGTPEALAERVALLVKDPARRRQMGDAARRWTRATFSIERMIDQTIEAYHSIKDYAASFPPDWQEPPPQGTLPLGGITRAGEHCFVAELPENVDVSGFSLWEDDGVLRRAEGNDQASVAGGRYSLSASRIFFSSADDSDPRFNGRSYCLRAQSFGFDEVLIDPAAIQAEIGNCFVVQLDLGGGSARFRLWEDGARLGPGSSLHDVIRMTGNGRYSVWGNDLYFSPSDNTDPRTNGRRYVLRREKLTRSAPAESGVGPDLPFEKAFSRLLANATPRPDFVAGRIINVTGSLGPGGAERQIVYTLTGLQRCRIESAQVLAYFLDATAEDRHDFYLSDLKAAGVPVRNIRRHIGEIDLDRLPVRLRGVHKVLPPELIADIADLYWEFIDLRPEVVHSWLDNVNDRAAIAAALAGVPRIMVAGRNLNPSNFAFYQPHMDAAYKALLDLPQVIMTNNSRAGRDDYAAWLGIEREKIPVVYNGIEFAEYTRPGNADRERLRERFSLASDSFVIGGVFRFAEEKRPLLWIETAAVVARRLPDAGFILFGDGELRGEMERLADRLGLSKRLVFAGIATGILDMIAMMDVLLLTSAHEGVPNVVLEAQWVGTPVVATRAGGTPEAVEEGVTGWIVDPPTIDALADRLVLLHDDPAACQEAQHRGPAFVRERFGVARMVDETLRLYGMRAAGAA